MLIRFSRRWWLTGCTTLLLILFFTHDAWLTALGWSLVYSEPPCHADAIVVLAGDFSGGRLLTGASLSQAGYAPVVLVSGPYTLYDHYECDLAIAFGERHGYPASLFVRVPHEATSTKAEAAVLLQEMARRHVQRFLLVTSNFHTRRARRLFLAEAGALPFCTVAAPNTNFTPDGWWKQREGRKTFFFEFTKTLTSQFGI